MLRSALHVRYSIVSDANFFVQHNSKTNYTHLVILEKGKTIFKFMSCSWFSAVSQLTCVYHNENIILHYYTGMFSFIGFRTRWTQGDELILQETSVTILKRKSSKISSYQKSIRKIRFKFSSSDIKTAGFDEVLLIFLFVHCLLYICCFSKIYYIEIYVMTPLDFTKAKPEIIDLLHTRF